MEDKTIYSKNGEEVFLLFHAYTSTPNDMLSMSKELDRQGYSVYAPTFSGHGKDDPDDILKYGIDDWVKDAEQAYTFLENEGFENIYVFGLSLGGLLATYLMIEKNPEIAGTFSSPTMASKEDYHVPENFEKWYIMKKRKLNNSNKPGMSDEAKQKLSTVIEGMNEFTHSMIPKYNQITGSIFIGQAGNDEMIDSNQAKSFKNALSNATVELKWYENAAHAITTGRVGKELRTDLMNFVDYVK